MERPGAVKGAPLLGAAKRTLDGEDRSKRIELEGKDRGNCDGSQFDANVQNIVVRYTMRYAASLRPPFVRGFIPDCAGAAQIPASNPLPRAGHNRTLSRQSVGQER